MLRVGMHTEYGLRWCMNSHGGPWELDYCWISGQVRGSLVPMLRVGTRLLLDFWVGWRITTRSLGLLLLLQFLTDPVSAIFA